MLEDEAADAVNYLKAYEQQQQEYMAQQQEAQRQEQEQQAAQFMDDLTSSINGLPILEALISQRRIEKRCSIISQELMQTV